MLIFLAFTCFGFALGVVCAVLCLAAKEADSVEEHRRAMRAAERCCRRV